MITIAELLVPVTTDQQLEKFLTALEDIGIKARSWRQAGSLRSILRVVAAAYAGFSTSILGFVQAGFLETALGGWLTLLAFYVYGVTRIAATQATGKVTLTNSGAGVYSIAINTLRIIANGKAFTNVAAISLNPGNVLSVDIIAIEAGTASNVAVGATWTIETTLPGVTCTNSAAIVGANAEIDADLRQRCKDRLGILSGRGPRGAYAYAIRSAVRTDGSPVDVNRHSISPSSSTGTLTVYVASPSGAPAPADLAFISTSIETYARPDTVTVSLNAATPVAFAKTLTVWAQRVDGVSAADIKALVEAALIAAISDYPVGGIAKPPSTQGKLYATFLEGVAKCAHSSIFAIDGVGVDVNMSPGQVATLAATVTVTLVDTYSS